MLLGRRIRELALEASCHGLVWALQDLRDAEVDDLRQLWASFRQDDVVRREVAMDHTDGVRRGEPRCQPCAERDHLCLAQLTITHAVRERDPVDQLHHEVDAPLVLEQIVASHDGVVVDL
jgi:hypothetical protein